MRMVSLVVLLAGIFFVTGCGSEPADKKGPASTGTMTNKQGKKMEAPPPLEKIK